MKRVIGLLLLFLANIVVLAHAVIPHHHHDKVVVSILNILFINDVLEHEHTDPLRNDGYAHSGAELNETCLLNELFIRSYFGQSVLSANSNDFDFTNSHSYSPIICYDIVPLIEILDYGELPFKQKPYVNSYHTHYITHSLGLRAPPFC